MPGFTPGRRWQPAYYPFHKEPLIDRIIAVFERSGKGLLFGCRMCGNCMLQETAFICPMECPKGLRNGPCGGSSAAHCYVDNTRPCIWYKIYQRSEKLGRTDRLLEVLPPLDWSKVGTDTWTDGLRSIKAKGGVRALWSGIKMNKQQRSQAIDRFFYEIRQPEWWQGDDQPHPPALHDPVSSLERKLKNGTFVITAEIAPPLTAETCKLEEKLNLYKPLVDAVNFTDNPSATPRMSSFASSLLALHMGVEPVMQIAARDRTRMGIQAEVLGASALGIRNILCLTGDHSSMGPAPHGRMDIWDIDSIQTLWLLRRMRDDNHFLDQREIKCAPQLFLGAAGSPFASEVRFQAIREEKKVNAGAQFFQTNLIYDVDGFERYLEALDKRDVLKRVYLLAGINPIRSIKAAHKLNQVPGIHIPKEIITRIENSSDAKEEGIQLTLEIIERIKALPSISGIHFMTVGWENVVPRLIEESGLRKL